MVFIWGNKGYTDHIGYIIHTCPSCSQPGPFSVYQQKKKFTVYFIPTFSYSSKQLIECGACKAAFEVPKELKPVIAENLMSQEELSALIRQAREGQLEENELATGNAAIQIGADAGEKDIALFGLGMQAVETLEKVLLPMMGDAAKPLPPERARAGYLAHSFALVWLGISINVPVDTGKDYMDRQIDMLHNELPRFGLDWTRDDTEAAVGRTWTAFVQGQGTPGEKLQNVARVIMEYFVPEDERGVTQLVEVVGAISPTLAGVKAVFEYEE